MMFRKALTFILLVAFSCAPATLKTKEGNRPKIQVIYPKKDQKINAVDSTFILGNVTPDASLYINNYRVPVYPEGGFIAFLPIDTGTFVFELRAKNDYGDTTLEWPVQVPAPFKIVSPDSLAILKEFTMPNVYQELTGGDLLELSIRGTPGALAQYQIQDLTDWRPLYEMPDVLSVPGSETVFGSENQRDSLLGSGVYRASMYLPSDTALDSMSVLYKLCKADVDSNSKVVLVNCLEDTARTKISLKKFDYPQVVELIDSVQTIRYGPRKGYLGIYQPAGVRFIADGKYDNYIRLKLGPGQPAWIPDTSVAFLPPGTPVPYSEVKYIRTFVLEGKTRVSIYLDKMLPFRVEADPANKKISILVYYATSNTDWIRYDTDDDLIKYITWSQPQQNIYRLDVQLNKEQIWGYDAHYEDNVLNLDIKKSPEEHVHIRDLKFVIDPGHSADPGSIGPTGLTEAEANLAIAKQLTDILRDKGAEVVMTRSGNENVELYERPIIGVQEDCDMFISIHNNALPDGINPFENHGTSTYYYHLQSMPLAQAIQKRMVEELEMGSYGQYYANFAVTRPTQYLSVLVECTFMILPEEESKLRGKDFPHKCAEAIAKGIDDFLDSQD